MKVCLVGDASEPDEARKVFLHNVKGRIPDHEVGVADLRHIRTRRFWQDLRRARPDIIHYVPGASPMSFAVTSAIKRASGARASVISAMFHPFHEGDYSRTISTWRRLKHSIRLFQADAVLVQSPKAEAEFARLGCNVRWFPSSGVDVDRFRPASAEQRRAARERYRVPMDKYVMLHVGSIRKWRNVLSLADLAETANDIQLVVVGRKDTPAEGDVAAELARRGAIVIGDYVEHVESLYAMADLYVFPTVTPVGAIDVPLSVLEAMSCNMPVLTTPFEGLPRLFEPKSGLVYARPEEFPERLRSLRASPTPVATRELVKRCDWRTIARNLSDLYKELGRGNAR